MAPPTRPSMRAELLDRHFCNHCEIDPLGDVLRRAVRAVDDRRARRAAFLEGQSLLAWDEHVAVEEERVLAILEGLGHPNGPSCFCLLVPLLEHIVVLHLAAERKLPPLCGHGLDL